MNPRTRIMALTALLVGLGLAYFPALAQADTEYTYTGNPYTTCDGTYTCTGTSPAMVVAIDLNLNGSALDNLNFSFAAGDNGPVLEADLNDGVVSFDGCDCWEGSLKTDSLGNVTSWFIEFENETEFGESSPGFDFTNTFNTMGTLGDGESLVSGTWSPYTAPNPMPEPSVFLMLGVGLLAACGLGLRQRTTVNTDRIA